MEIFIQQRCCNSEIAVFSAKQNDGWVIFPTFMCVPPLFLVTWGNLLSVVLCGCDPLWEMMAAEWKSEILVVTLSYTSICIWLICIQGQPPFMFMHGDWQQTFGENFAHCRAPSPLQAAAPWMTSAGRQSDRNWFFCPSLPSCSASKALLELSSLAEGRTEGKDRRQSLCCLCVGVGQIAINAGIWEDFNEPSLLIKRSLEGSPIPLILAVLV